AAGSYRRTLGWGDHTLLSEVTPARGGVAPTHQHPHEQIGYNVRGASQFKTGDQLVALHSAHGSVTPAHTPHRVLALEETVDADGADQLTARQKGRVYAHHRAPPVPDRVRPRGEEGERSRGEGGFGGEADDPESEKRAEGPRQQLVGVVEADQGDRARQ